MKNHSVAEIMQEHYPMLTVSEKALADFMLNNLETLCFANSAEIADIVGVSKPTMSRLYRKLGFANAQEFKRLLRSEYSVSTMNTESVVQSQHDSEQIRAHCDREFRAIADSFHKITADTFTAIVQMVASANSVYTMGQYENSALASLAAMQWQQVRDHVTSVFMEEKALAAVLSEMSENDVLVIFALHHSSDELLQRSIQTAQKLHIAVIVISDSLQQYEHYSHVTTLFAQTAGHVTVSFTSAVSIITCVAESLAEVAQRDIPPTLGNSRKTDRKSNIERVYRMLTSS